MANIGSGSVINKVRLAQQGSSPAAPPSTYWLLYVKAGGLYYKDSANNEYQVGKAADAASIQGKAVDTTAPTSGQVLAWDGGASKYVPTTGPLGIIQAQTVTGSPAATIDFAAIPGTYRNLLLKLHGATDRGVNNSIIVMGANGDTGANYDLLGLFVQDSSVAGAESDGLDNLQVRIGRLATTAGPANAPGAITVWIPQYANTGFSKIAQCRAAMKFHSGSPGYDIEDVLWSWNSTAAITELTLACFNGENFVVGTTAVLYGES